ncbi:MAG: ATP-binding protein, partial [Anaeromyxobacteraceae bacterium]
MPYRDVLESSSPTGERALEALRAAVEGTARAAGEDFFPALCKALCRALDVTHALVGELTPDGRSVAVRAVCWNGECGEPFVYPLSGTPCEMVLGRGESVFVPTGVAAAFPNDAALARRKIDAYLGAPLFDHDGRKIGALVVMSDREIDPSRAPRALLEIFAARAASELERLRLQAQLLRSQRLEGMGRLAAGVAHDFNNLLTVILSNAEFADSELPAESRVRDYLAPIHEASRRATRLTRQLLSFSRRQPSAPQVIDLRAEVTGVLRLLESLVGETVAVEARLDEAWPVRIDPGQLEQLLVNLAVNARDAMRSGGVIVVRTSRESLDPVRAGERGVVPGDWVRLTVSDDGAGMDEETCAHCFEPFYSTKGDRGTGIGLATCHALVQRAGGQIWVESTPGHGTSVHVLLPAQTGAATSERRREPEPAPPQA